MMNLRSRAGFVLILVIGLLGALAMLSMSLMETTKSARVLSMQMLETAKSRLAAHSAIEMGKTAALESLKQGNPIHRPQSLNSETSAQISYGIRATARVRENSGAIHLNDGIAAGKTELGGAYDSAEVDPWNSSATPSLLWKKHPITAINVNYASEFVRTAVFFATCNVSYVAEGIMEDSVRFGPDSTTRKSGRPTLGVAGPIFENDHDNGVSSVVQKNRLMSMRDAWCLSLAYESYCSTVRYPDGFKQFEDMLRSVRKDVGQPYRKTPYERVGNFKDVSSPQYKRVLFKLGGAWTHANHSSNPMLFNQDYIERTLPHVLSAVRRTPGWLHAPWALLSPYMQETKIPNGNMGGGSIYSNHEEKALRSVEDFVFRAQLPKIQFVPDGLVDIHGIGTNIAGDRMFLLNIKTTVRLFDSKTYRFQDQFVAATDPTSSSTIITGPEIENGSEPASKILGVVGLKDRKENVKYGNRPHSIAMYFDGNLDDSGAGTKNYDPTDPSSDPFTNPPAGAAPVLSFPSGYTSYPDFSTPYDPDVLDDFNATPPAGETWKRPKNALAMLNTSFSSLPWLIGAVPGGPWSFPLNETQMANFVFQMNAWLTGLGFPLNPAPPASASPEEISWLLLQQPGHVFVAMLPNFSLNDWFKFDPPTHPDPASFVAVAESPLYGSQLEGADRSVFGAGAEGCDLSAFGGVSLSSRGHGTRSAKLFTDSLFWRPYPFIGANAPGDTPSVNVGSVFNKGTISMWYRVPAGYWGAHRMTLFHMTFWEKVEELLEQTPTSPVTRVVYRPVYISGNLQLDGLLATELAISNGPALTTWTGNKTVPTWSDDVNLPLMSFPQNITQFPADFMGVMPGLKGSNANSPNNTTNQDYYQRYQRDRYWMNGSSLRISKRSPRYIRARHHRAANMAPGSWCRVVFTWDLSDLDKQVSQGYKGTDDIAEFESSLKNGSADIGTTQLYKDTYESTNSTDGMSYNKRMIISIGEMPYYTDIPDYNSSIPFSVNRLDDETYYPFERINSLVDNIDIRFGDTLTGSVEDYSGYETNRYDIIPANEPEWLVDFDIPNGSQLISIGSRTYDVPYSPYVFKNGSEVALDRYAGGQGYTAPWVDLVAKDGGTPLNPSYKMDTTSTVPFRSPELASFSNDTIGQDFRLSLKYKATTPSGASYLTSGLSNIPWIKEVSVMYTRPEGPQIVTWKEE